MSKKTKTSQRACSICRQPGHRADKCPQAGAGGAVARLDPGAADRAVDQLVALAMDLGKIQGLAAVEKATGEVLKVSQDMRLALIKSRSANAKLRARLADQAEARTLARLDKEEGAGKGD